MSRPRTCAIAVALATCVALASIGTARAESDDTNPSSWTLTDVTEANVQLAIEELPRIIADVRARTGVPGIAAAVVYQGQVPFAGGFGEREVGTGAPVDANTVFQMASVSKPVGATVVSRAISDGIVDWNDPIEEHLPDFALASPYVSHQVTLGDMYSHRSGLPQHAGDDLEDIGYDRAQVLDRLRYLPLDPFRVTYHYTNFGLTAAAEAVARAAGMSWASLARRTLFDPVGMSSSSFVFSDYADAANRAVTHMKIDGRWQHGQTRNAQAQAPAGGLSSTANDMARWLQLQLGNGTIEGRELIDGDVLQIMRQPHIISSPSLDPSARAGMYGYGLNTSVDGTGHVRWSHSGAFLLGAGTVIDMLPAADLGIVVMSNAQPIGAVESIAASFMDIATTGAVHRDWLSAYQGALAPMFVDRTILAGRTPPANAKSSLPLDAYAGTYSNPYVGAVEVIRQGSGLVLVLGPKAMTFPLTSWGGNRFSYVPAGENGLGRSAVDFAARSSTVTIEQLNEYGMGTLTRRA